MKKLLIVIVFVGGFLQSMDRGLRDRFELAREVVAGYAKEEISKGMDPKVLSTNIFFGEPNWLNNLYKCTQLAKNNKGCNSENSHAFDDCISFFNKIEQYTANNDSDKKDVINKITFFKNYFTQKKYRYLKEQAKLRQQLIKEVKRSQQEQNFNHVEGILDSLSRLDSIPKCIRVNSDIYNLLNECKKAVNKESLLHEDKVTLSQCRQFFGKIKDGSLDRKKENQSLFEKFVDKTFNRRDKNVEVLDSLQEDVIEKLDSFYLINSFDEIMESSLKDSWQKLEPILNERPDAKSDKIERFLQKQYILGISECKKFVTQEGLIDNPGVYDKGQYTRCDNALSSLINSIKTNDSYVNSFFGYTKQKIDSIEKMRKYLKLVHQQKLLETFIA